MSDTAAARVWARSRSNVADATTVLAGLVAVAIFLVFARKGAGYEGTVWLPAALLFVGLAGSTVIGLGGRVALSRPHAVALIAFAGFTVWSYASVSWAGVKGEAWTGSNRTLLYLAVFTLFSVLPWAPKAAHSVIVAYMLGITLIGAAAVERAATSNDDALFVHGLFAFPTEYPNANAALFMCAFWIAVVLASRREQPVPVRAVALGAAAFLPQVAVLSQSRTAFIAVPLTAVLVITLMPDRLRTAAALACALAPVALLWDVHARVPSEAEDNPRFLEAAMQPSARWMAVTAVLAAGGGLVWAVVDRRVALSRAAMRALRVVAVMLAVGILTTGVVVAALASPVEKARSGWAQFTSVEPDYEGGTPFDSLGSGRYDEWRVALSRWRDQPLHGIGAENFAVDYVRERRVDEEPKYPHSLEIGILSQLGLVGAALFATFAVAVAWAAFPRRADEPLSRTVRAAAMGAAVYWIAHASADWFYELPALTAPVMAFAGLAAALGASRDKLQPRGNAAKCSAIAAAAAGVIAAVALGTLWLAEREMQQAARIWASDAGQAYDRLERARKLNPLSAEPDLLAGAIAARLDQRALMLRYFTASLRRDPRNWYTRLELGLTYSVLGRRAAALREVRRAVSLNPSEPVLRDVLTRLRRGERIEPRSLDAVFVDRIVEYNR